MRWMLFLTDHWRIDCINWVDYLFAQHLTSAPEAGHLCFWWTGVLLLDWRPDVSSCPVVSWSPSAEHTGGDTADRQGGSWIVLSIISFVDDWIFCCFYDNLMKYVHLWGVGGTFRRKGHGFDSRCSRHVDTLGKSFTLSCLWCFGIKFWHSIRAVLGAPLSSSGLEEAL